MFCFSSRRRHTRWPRDWSSDVCSSDLEHIGLGREITDAEVDIRSGWAGPAYGIPEESTVEAIRTTARLEGVILDPVYEGKRSEERRVGKKSTSKSRTEKIIMRSESNNT